jgi:hypothetical protein
MQYIVEKELGLDALTLGKSKGVPKKFSLGVRKKRNSPSLPKK